MHLHSPRTAAWIVSLTVLLLASLLLIACSSQGTFAPAQLYRYSKSQGGNPPEPRITGNTPANDADADTDENADADADGDSDADDTDADATNEGN